MEADKPLESLSSHLQLPPAPTHSHQLTRGDITVSVTPSPPPSVPLGIMPRDSRLKLVQVAAKSTPDAEKVASPSAIPKNDASKPSRPITPKKVTGWQKLVNCCCCCFPSCRGSSKVIPASKAQALEDAAVKEITSKIFTGAKKTMSSRGQTAEIDWTYDMITHDMQNLADTNGVSLPGIRSDAIGEVLVGRAVINNYKTLAEACPADKKKEFQKELVYRTIHLTEIANKAPVYGTERAAEFRDALLASAKNFDGDENEQIGQLIAILGDRDLGDRDLGDKDLDDKDKVKREFRSRVVGNIQGELYDAILESLETHLKSSS